MYIVFWQTEIKLKIKLNSIRKGRWRKEQKEKEEAS